jgi:ABC-type antimicrobial peptide transport system permease subunit
MRTWLTVLSILIGVMAIFALVSFGLGIRHYVDILGEEMGVDVLYIQTKGLGLVGTDEEFYITTDEIDFLGKINGVKEVIGMHAKAAKIKHKDEVRYSFAIGYDPKYQDFIDKSFTIEVE